MFKNTDSVTSCQNSVFAKLSGCQRNRKEEENKQNGKRPKLLIKIMLFKGGHPKMGKWKNGVWAKIAWHYLCQEGRKRRAFSCTLSVLAKKVFWSKTAKPGKTMKIVVSAETAKNQNDTIFLEKGAFLWWVKKWVLLTVFLKSCALLKTLFVLCFQQNTAVAVKKLYVAKTKIMKSSGLFWTW